MSLGREVKKFSAKVAVSAAVIGAAVGRAAFDTNIQETVLAGGIPGVFGGSLVLALDWAARTGSG